MYTHHVRLQVALLIGSVIAVWAEIWLLPSVSHDMASQVLWGLKSLATVGTQVSLVVGTHNCPQSTKTQTSNSTDFTYPHALQNTATSYSGEHEKKQSSSEC